MFVSCNDDDASLGAPVVENVSLAHNDSLVEQGTADNMYIIRGKGFSGTSKIYFNDTDTYFNPVYVTDNVIMVTIDRNTPYENATNELKIVTPRGIATYSFVVAPPGPAITGFNPVNATVGETIKIRGSFFLDPVVTFGDIPATVISSTLTEITVQVPEGATNKHIIVTTISGEATSWAGVGTAIYDDVFYNGIALEGATAASVTDINAAQGNNVLKATLGGWASWSLNWTWNDQLSNYAGIRMAIRAENDGKVAIILNGNWNDAMSGLYDVQAGWNYIDIPWSAFGGVPPAFQSLVLKNNTGAENTFYVDDLGFTLIDED